MSSRYYRSLLNSAKSSLSDYKKRKRQLEDIRDNYSKFDHYAEELNDLCWNAAESSRQGIVLTEGTNNPDDVFGDRDYGSGDADLSDSKAKIDAEITNVDDKIADLEKSISSYRSSMESEERREQEEREKKKNNK